MHSKRRDDPHVKDSKVGQPLLEAQVVDAADSLAYDTHDIDDALSFGLIVTDDLAELPFWKRPWSVPKANMDHCRLAAATDGHPGVDRLAGERSAGTQPARLTATAHRQCGGCRAAARS